MELIGYLGADAVSGDSEEEEKIGDSDDDSSYDLEKVNNDGNT